MAIRLEQTILKNLIHNEEFTNNQDSVVNQLSNDSNNRLSDDSDNDPDCIYDEAVPAVVLNKKNSLNSNCRTHVNGTYQYPNDWNVYLPKNNIGSTEF